MDLALNEMAEHQIRPHGVTHSLGERRNFDECFLIQGPYSANIPVRKARFCLCFFLPDLGVAILASLRGRRFFSHVVSSPIL